MALKVVSIKYHKNLIERIDALAKVMNTDDESAIYVDELSRGIVLRLAIFKGLKDNEKSFGMYYENPTQPHVEPLDPSVGSARGPATPPNYIKCTVNLQEWVIIRLENLLHRIMKSLPENHQAKYSPNRTWLFRACAFHGLKALEDDNLDFDRPPIIGSPVHKDFLDTSAQIFPR